MPAGKITRHCWPQKLPEHFNRRQNTRRRRTTMLIKILIGLAVLIVVFIIVVATRPADFRVTRTATISAPTAVVFGQVNDLHKWEAWNPWGKLDPACKMTCEGPAAGAGAGYTWAGNNKVGE